jgi:hypothetical protein
LTAASASGADPIASAAPASRPNAIALTAAVPGSDGCLGRGAILAVADLCIAALAVRAIVMRVRRHDPSMRALRFFLCEGRGNVADFADEDGILFVLGHSGTRKMTHEAECRSRGEYSDHVPTPLPC